MAKETQWDPATTGEIYNRHVERWQMELDFSEMTLDVLSAGTYLPRFSDREHEDDYAYRLAMSVPLDICRDAVRIRRDNLWRTPPRRDWKDSPYAALIEQLVSDADGESTPLDVLMQRAAWNYYVTGVDIVAQMTAAPDGQEIVSRQDETNARIRPYFSLLVPLNRYDWSCNAARNYQWVRYFMGDKPREDERGGGENVETYLTYLDSEWRRYSVVRDDKGEPTIDTLTGAHTAGRVPVIKLYFSESEKSDQPATPLSLLTRPAIVAKIAMSIKSQADADLLAAVTRWWGTGIGTEELPDTYGPAMFIKFPNPESKIGVVQGDVAHITEKREWLMLYLGEILRLLKFRGGMAEINANSGSGLKLAIERTDLDNELRTTAAQLEQAELEMMRLAVNMATGAGIKPQEAAEKIGYSAEYNRDFVLEPIGDLLDSIVKWSRDAAFLSDAVPGITKQLVRQLGNLLARDGSPVDLEIAEQADALSAESRPAPEPVAQSAPQAPVVTPEATSQV